MGFTVSAEGIVLILLAFAALAYIAGRIMMVVAGFHEEQWAWGVVALLPLAWLVFVMARWEQAKDGFYYVLFAVGLLILSAFNFHAGSMDIKPHKTLWKQAQRSVDIWLGRDAAIRSLTYTKESAEQQGIRKCISQSTGVIAYTDKPCEEGFIEMTESAEDSGTPVNMGEPVPPVPAPGDKQASIRPSQDFECDNSRIYCSQMTSCDEAIFFHKHCPGVMLDMDGDGNPCDKEWCGENFSPMY